MSCATARTHLPPLDLTPVGRFKDAANEAAELRWMTPAEALRRCSAGEMALMPPQWHMLTQLAGQAHESAAALVESVRRGERCAPVFRPRILRLGGGGRAVVLEGDEDHDEAPGAAGERHRIVFTPDAAADSGAAAAGGAFTRGAYELFDTRSPEGTSACPRQPRARL